MRNQLLDETHHNIITHTMGETAEVTTVVAETGSVLAIAHESPLGSNFTELVTDVFLSDNRDEVFVNLTDILSSDKRIVWAFGNKDNIGERLATKAISAYLPQHGRIDLEAYALEQLGKEAVVSYAFTKTDRGIKRLVYVDRSFTPEQRKEINELFSGGDDEQGDAIRILSENPLAIYELYAGTDVGVNAVALVMRINTLKEYYSFGRELHGVIKLEVKLVNDGDGNEPYYVHRNFQLDLATLNIPHQYQHQIQNNAYRTFRDNHYALLHGMLGHLDIKLKDNDPNFTPVEFECSSTDLFTSLNIVAKKKPTLPPHCTNAVTVMQ